MQGINLDMLRHVFNYYYYIIIIIFARDKSLEKPTRVLTVLRMKGLILEESDCTLFSSGYQRKTYNVRKHNINFHQFMKLAHSYLVVNNLHISLIYFCFITVFFLRYISLKFHIHVGGYMITKLCFHEHASTLIM